VRAVKPQGIEEKRLSVELLRRFEQNGLKLSDTDLEKFKDLSKKLESLKTLFAKNLNEDTSFVTFTKEELKGVPESFLSGLKKDAQGRFIVTTKEPDYRRVIQNATLSDTRKKMQFANYNRQTEANTPLLEKAILLRQEIAHLLGYKTWADYNIHGRMAKDSKEVLSFLNSFRRKLSVRKKKDLAALLAMKRETDPQAQQLDSWDLSYFDYQLKKRAYSIDDEEIRPYFPADRAVQKLFEIYSTLFGIELKEVSGAQVWSPDVKLYEIRNKGKPDVIAYFYADFFPREGKYGHAAAFQLITGRKDRDGSYRKPIASIVSNFSAPQGKKPSLLNHDELETLFHEFGHIMHQTLTRARFAFLSGTDVAQDFVEAPSQMLENWVWERSILKEISGHYQDPKKKLPDTLIDKLIAAWDFDRAYFYTRQLWFALTDMKYHTTDGPVDSTRVMNDMHQELLGVEMLPGTHFQAGFGHLMGGYDAGYYGYLWSEVFAEDMFTRFKGKSLLSPKVGGEYRRWILEKGRMEDPKVLLRKFLGRPANNKAFFKKLGIQ
jgi:thimet oligopeptidase